MSFVRRLRHLRRRPAPPPALEPVRPMEERGSFTHAFCPSCGWDGPGRRARASAARDAAEHELLGCSEVTVAALTEHTPPASR